MHAWCWGCAPPARSFRGPRLALCPVSCPLPLTVTRMCSDVDRGRCLNHVAWPGEAYMWVPAATCPQEPCMAISVCVSRLLRPCGAQTTRGPPLEFPGQARQTQRQKPHACSAPAFHRLPSVRGNCPSRLLPRTLRGEAPNNQIFTGRGHSENEINTVE